MSLSCYFAVGHVNLLVCLASCAPTSLPLLDLGCRDQCNNFRRCRHMKLVLFGLYTWWIPQIVLSAVMDGRQPLKPVYIIGTSAARLALPLYLYGCPANLLRIPPAQRMLAALIASVAAQVWTAVGSPHDKNLHKAAYVVAVMLSFLMVGLCEL